MMRRSMLLVVLMASLPAIAGEKVIAVNGIERTYIERINKRSDGVIEITPSTYFVGDRIVRDDAGECFKVTSLLNSIKEDKDGAFIELPDLTVIRVKIDCPS